jgi:hypothetical protein
MAKEFPEFTRDPSDVRPITEAKLPARYGQAHTVGPSVPPALALEKPAVPAAAEFPESAALQIDDEVMLRCRITHLLGGMASLEILDDSGGRWGHLNVPSACLTRIKPDNTARHASD